ncbi:zinc ribbon domain-containing protein [Patescibacteria group bacterium]|nr:zinc ribbon domain-containing protein [Patescibacteria group bacterium]MCG2688759.1 zinc ribbon domain-containing protein [Candidatus Parcubacteria bacterium]
MFCHNCGIKIKSGAEFCGGCGKKVEGVSGVISTTTKERVGEVQFYSEDWRRKKFLALASLPYFDIMLDKKYLYIIKMPKYRGATVWTILGFFVLSLIGMAIGYYIGSSSDEKKRRKYRFAWINTEHKLVSHSYTNSIFLKVPMEELKKAVFFRKSRFTLNYNSEEIILAKTSGELNRFRESIKNI